MVLQVGTVILAIYSATYPDCSRKYSTTIISGLAEMHPKITSMSFVKSKDISEAWNMLYVDNFIKPKTKYQAAWSDSQNICGRNRKFATNRNPEQKVNQWSSATGHYETTCIYDKTSDRGKCVNKLPRLLIHESGMTISRNRKLSIANPTSKHWIPDINYSPGQNACDIMPRS